MSTARRSPRTAGRLTGALAGALASLLLLAACSTGSPSTPVSSPEESTTGSESTATETESSAESPTETATTPVGLEQPAVWPGADTTFATPEEAAADLVEQVRGMVPDLGEFMAGDSRSGELPLYFAGEDGSAQLERSLLLMRQLGSADGWYVLAAINEQVTVDAPEQGATVPAGPLEVSGSGRGFEGTVVVMALRPGDPTPIDTQIAAGGQQTSEPYSVTLDLSGTTIGETVAVLVYGDSGADNDPGELSAVAVTIG